MLNFLFYIQLRFFMSDWPHAPPHRLMQEGTYMVTAGTYKKLLLFNTKTRLDFLQSSLLTFAKEFKWKLQAWAIFANHYHFIANSPENPDSLSQFLGSLHRYTATEINKQDNIPGRKVWYQFYDSHITFQKSYYARIQYVIENPVRHGFVNKSLDYPWCSASWFTQMASPAFRKTIESFKIDKLEIIDDF